jgi:hypothetical protein
MSRHRFVELVADDRSGHQVPGTPTTPTLSGFVVCPLAVQEWLVGRNCQWQIYEQALRDALALAVPSVLDRYSANLIN